MLNDRLNKLNVSRSDYTCQENLSLDFLKINQARTGFGFELAIDILDILYLKKYDASLSTVEQLILEGIWQKKTYGEIAQENHYSADYLSNVAAPKLLKQLSKLLECRINKKNCRSMVTNFITQIWVNCEQYPEQVQYERQIESSQLHHNLQLWEEGNSYGSQSQTRQADKGSLGSLRHNRRAEKPYSAKSSMPSSSNYELNKDGFISAFLQDAISLAQAV